LYVSKSFDLNRRTQNPKLVSMLRLKGKVSNLVNGKIDTNGFTLVEVLIAVFIFAIILSTIFTTYTGAFRIMDQTEAQTDIYAMARTTLERMIEDLESVYVIPGANNKKTTADTQGADLFVGEEKEINGRTFDSLRFLSMAHLSFSDTEVDPGATRISYYAVKNDRETGATLFRSDTPEFDEAPEEGSGGLPLCEGLSSVDFTYYSSDGEAHERWDSTSEKFSGNLPVMVFVSLEFVNKADPGSPIRFSTGVSLPIAGKMHEKAPQR